MTRHDKSTDTGLRSTGPKGVGPEEFSVFMPPRARRPGLAARHILFLGVAGACVMGVGLGLWARPALSERQATAAPQADAPKAVPPAAARQLQIVVDNRPAPMGKPIDVLPASAPLRPEIARPQIPPAAAAPLADPTPLAPARPPQGFLRVRNVTPPPAAEPAPPPKRAALTIAALLAPRPAPPRVQLAPPVHAAPVHLAPVHLASAHAAPTHLAPAHLAPTHLAKAAPVAKPVAKPNHQVELARAAAAKAAAHKLELAGAAKAARQQQIELARAEAKGRAEARAEARTEALAFARDDAKKRARLAALAHAVQRLLPHKAAPEPVEVAKLDRRHAHKARHEPQVERASLRTHRASHVAEPAVRARAVQIPPPSRASGLMKVSAPRCANRDPGQALVCADPSLGAADRQLSRAYQDARNAGVPDVQLQRQQQRWLAARSAAAREAPWAVHDVYLARIAELNGQAREAHGDGY